MKVFIYVLGRLIVFPGIGKPWPFSLDKKA
jgi:hypothetical protein